MRVAIDTNVLIAALTHPPGKSARIVDAWLDGQLEVVASEATIREAELVLGGGWLGRLVSFEAVETLLEALRRRSVLVEEPAPIADLGLKMRGTCASSRRPCRAVPATSSRRTASSCDSGDTRVWSSSRRRSSCAS